MAFAAVLAAQPRYELLLKGGHVIDPGEGRNGVMDVAIAAGKVAVLAPSRWLRAADTLPHSWDVTSDSVAAFVAGALDAARLDLVKPADVGWEGVDRCFAAVVPAGLEVRVVGWERFVEETLAASG